jgi:hypothetical protein
VRSALGHCEILLFNIGTLSQRPCRLPITNNTIDNQRRSNQQREIVVFAIPRLQTHNLKVCRRAPVSSGLPHIVTEYLLIDRFPHRASYRSSVLGGGQPSSLRNPQLAQWSSFAVCWDVRFWNFRGIGLTVGIRAQSRPAEIIATMSASGRRKRTLLPFGKLRATALCYWDETFPRRHKISCPVAGTRWRDRI